MHNPADVSGGIQAAIKNLASNNVFYFNIPVSLEVVFAAGAAMEVGALAAAWKGIEESLEVSTLVNGEYIFHSSHGDLTLETTPQMFSRLFPFDLILTFNHPTFFSSDLPTVDLEVIKSKLGAKDIAFVAKRDVPGQEGQQVAVYFFARTVTNAQLFIELKFKTGMNLAKVTVRSTNKHLSELCKVAVAKLLI